MGEYARKEKLFAEPFAVALAEDAKFLSWVLERTKFAGAPVPRVLTEEMEAKRSRVAKTWWGSHFSERCRCFGCSGSETDILAIVADSNQRRFALHIEVKNPDDKFQDVMRQQAARYPVRAACWSGNPPPNVLPHDDACTILLCSAAAIESFDDDAKHFNAVITFEDLARDFPHATKSGVKSSLAPSRFALGQRVFHGKFGYGTITAIEGNKLEIDFEKAGQKRVLDSFVSAE